MKPRTKDVRRQFPDERRGEWICGLNPVLEAARAGRVREILVSSGRHEKLAQIQAIAGEKGVAVRPADTAFFESRFPKGHQGIAALVNPKQAVSVDDLLLIPGQRGESPLFIILDCLEDPRNFGAILRSADAAGVHGIVIQTHRSVRFGPEVAKASAGAYEYMAVSVVPNIKHAMGVFREAGIVLVGADADAPGLYWDEDLSMPLCLIIGSEGKGLRKTVAEQCDRLVRMPMMGAISSLNASVATGILLFESIRQRSLLKRSPG